mmetsp:Transcript_15414/g.33302  ORF Transcript_15414/g.33302 Transcript_15414/m.33302 type:complete len:82 (+) Transcript_15414:1460-1705(+)
MKSRLVIISVASQRACPVDTTYPTVIGTFTNLFSLHRPPVSSADGKWRIVDTGANDNLRSLRLRVAHTPGQLISAMKRKYM